MSQPYHHGALATALLGAAEAILERDGIAALTMRAAARGAGVSHAAPAHHFRDLSGLLSELAASGFVRLRNTVQAEIAAAGPESSARLVAAGKGYVGFAREHPGLFQLMFRSERLDWSSPTLWNAGAAAFSLLTEGEPPVEPYATPRGFQALVAITARWSLMHGLATLLIDGRLGPMTAKMPEANAETLIQEVLTFLARQEPLGS